MGQTAAPLAASGAEIGASLGAGYARVAVSSSNNAASYVAVPAVEANLGYGVSDTLALNLHAGTAGLEPGVKIALSHGGSFDVALLPAVGFGMFRAASESSTSSANSSAYFLSILAGARLLASVPGGVYAEPRGRVRSRRRQRPAPATGGRGAVPNLTFAVSTH